MSIELYRKEFTILEEGKIRVMIGKAVPHYTTGQKKLSVLHISPVTLENYDGTILQLSRSSDRCVRLYFSKPYTSAQRRAMYAEIRHLAAEKLLVQVHDSSNLEQTALIECLEKLCHIQ